MLLLLLVPRGRGPSARAPTEPLCEESSRHGERGCLGSAILSVSSSAPTTRSPVSTIATCGDVDAARTSHGCARAGWAGCRCSLSSCVAARLRVGSPAAARRRAVSASSSACGRESVGACSHPAAPSSEAVSPSPSSASPHVSSTSSKSTGTRALGSAATGGAGGAWGSLVPKAAAGAALAPAASSAHPPDAL